MAVTGPPFFSIGQRVAVVGGKTSSITGRPTLPVFGSAATAPTYDTDAQAYFDAVVTAGGAALSTSDKDAYNSFVVSLKGSGAWTNLDRLAWFGGPHSIAALRDIRNPAKVWTAIGAPAFTAYAGYTGDGVAAWVSSVDNMTVGPNFAQDSCCIGAYINHTNGTGIDYALGSGSNNVRLYTGTTGNTGGVQLNATSGPTQAGAADRNGFRAGNRPGSATSTEFYFNPPTAAATTTTVTADAAVVVSPIRVLSRTSSSFAVDRALFAFYGGAMTATQMRSIYTSVLTLATALGCPLS